MTDASALIDRAMNTISAKLKDNDFLITMDRNFLEKAYGNLYRAQQKSMLMEEHIRRLEDEDIDRCEDCARVIKSYNLVLGSNDKVRTR